MSRESSLRAFIEEALAAHQVINANLDRLVTTSDEGRPDLGGDFLELRELLVRHFEAEEHSDMFGVIRELLPDCDARVDGLVAEHHEICRVLEKAAAHLTKEAMPGAELRRALDLLRLLLASHELAERELMTEALAALG